MTNVLEISNLGGGYNRRKIIDNINIQIPKGSITALIGLNGAGKSTTISSGLCDRWICENVIQFSLSSYRCSNVHSI